MQRLCSQVGKGRPSAGSSLNCLLRARFAGGLLPALERLLPRLLLLSEISWQICFHPTGFWVYSFKSPNLISNMANRAKVIALMEWQPAWVFDGEVNMIHAKISFLLSSLPTSFPPSLLSFCPFLPPSCHPAFLLFLSLSLSFSLRLWLWQRPSFSTDTAEWCLPPVPTPRASFGSTRMCSWVTPSSSALTITLAFYKNTKIDHKHQIV